MNPYIGCAGWAIGKQFNPHFPAEGTHLQRYAVRLNAVEINSSFYRPHREATYARWADATPADFRFAVKMPKVITHEKTLRDAKKELDRFLLEIRGLGAKTGPILVQLPPRLKWDLSLADDFFGYLRSRVATAIVCEPRHMSWFDAAVDSLLKNHAVSRVIADPPIAPTDATREILGSLCYFRLHGSPRIYYSTYDQPFLSQLADRIAVLARDGVTVWCVFDNTALGAATKNALSLHADMLKSEITSGPFVGCGEPVPTGGKD